MPWPATRVLKAAWCATGSASWLAFGWNWEDIFRQAPASPPTVDTQISRIQRLKMFKKSSAISLQESNILCLTLSLMISY